MALEKKGDGGGEIVHVAAAGLVNITPGEEMHVRCLHIDVSLKLPRQVHIECSSDVAGSIVERGNRHESGHGIHGIVSRVPPKRTRASINRNLWQGMDGKVRMDANDILRSDQAGIIEIAGFEEERVEGSEVPIIWIVVAAGGAGFEPEPLIPPRAAGITCIYLRGPRQDRIVAKAAHLERLLSLQVPMVPGSELARAQCMAVLVRNP